MKPQHLAGGFFGVKPFLHQPCPQPPGGAKLRHFFKDIRSRAEEKGQARRKGVDVQPGLNGRLHVGARICQGKRNLLNRSCPGLTYMVPGDRNGVELRHRLVAPCHNVRRQPQTGTRGENIGSPGNVLL